MNWKKAESRTAPEALDKKTSRAFNYVRRNIKEVERKDEDGTTYTMFEYEELVVPKADWELFETVTDSTGRLDDVENALVELAEIIGGE